MENTSTPSALLLSRQNIKDIPPAAGSSRYADALFAARGAYIVLPAHNPQIILVANGSEVATCYEAALKLKSDGIRVQVVSAPSEGLFREQPVEYQLKVIPPGVPVFGLTAGLPVTLQGLVGPGGKVFGLGSFGFSAPYKVLDEKLGFTPDQVYQQVKNLFHF